MDIAFVINLCFSVIQKKQESFKKKKKKQQADQQWDFGFDTSTPLLMVLLHTGGSKSFKIHYNKLLSIYQHTGAILSHLQNY